MRALMSLAVQRPACIATFTLSLISFFRHSFADWARSTSTWRTPVEDAVRAFSYHISYQRHFRERNC